MEHLTFNGIFGEIKFTKYLAQGPDKSTAERQSLGHDMGFVTFIQYFFNVPTVPFDKCFLPEARFLLKANADRVLTYKTPCLKPGRFSVSFVLLKILGESTLKKKKGTTD